MIRVLGPRDPDHAYDTDLLAALQRASGVVVLVFVGLHLWEFRAQTWMHGLAESSYSTKLVADLSSTKYGVPWIALGYVVGIAATRVPPRERHDELLHDVGLHAHGAAAQRRARVVFRVAGVLLFALSSAIVVQLATGSRLFPATEPTWPAFACGPEALLLRPRRMRIPAATVPRPAIVVAAAPPLPSGGH